MKDINFYKVWYRVRYPGFGNPGGIKIGFKIIGIKDGIKEPAKEIIQRLMQDFFVPYRVNIRNIFSIKITEIKKCLGRYRDYILIEDNKIRSICYRVSEDDFGTIVEASGEDDFGTIVEASGDELVFEPFQIDQNLT